MPGAPPTPHFTWNESQRRVLLVLLTILLASLVTRYACNRMYVSDPQPPHPPREAELEDRIDPNTADWQTLAALPVIGEKRAKDIVAYREKFEETNPGQRAFARAEDLIRVKGIGEATVQSLAPYLIFSATTQATSPP